jgi:mercuric ion binding protein
MDCEACPITVRKALEKTPGVKSAKVDLPTKSAVVEYDPRVTTLERLMKSTANAGYPSAVKSGN